MRRPAFQFYPADWRKDPALSACSLSARGLWIELMCVAHEGETYGVLSINGKPMVPAQIARMVGESPSVVNKLLAELEDAGVFSRDEQGCIYSRRMVKDERLRNVRADAGRLGGNPNLLKQKDKQTGNQIPTPSSSSSSSPSGNEEPNGSLSPDESDDDAERFEKQNLPHCPHGDILAVYAEVLPELPQPRADLWDGERAKSLRARWRWCLTAKNAEGKRYATCRDEGVEWFRRYFRYVRRCPHLMGDNDRGWTPDLEWLVTAKNFTKVMQGNYDRKEAAA